MQVTLEGLSQDASIQDRDLLVNAMEELDWELPKGDAVGKPAIMGGVVTDAAVPAIEEAIKASCNFTMDKFKETL